MSVKPKYLRADYSSEADVGINGYNAAHEPSLGNKDAFLRDASAVLRATAKEMVADGWVNRLIRSDGGIGVSGNVYLTLRNGDYKKMLLVTYTSIPQLGRPSDGAALYVQVRDPGTNQLIEGNIWLSADSTHVEIAEALRVIIRRF